jgi:ribosomal protein S18 acetylase RimI-like enzyme
MISVRLAQTGDHEILADLGRRAFQEAFGRFHDPDDMQAYLDLSFNHETIRIALTYPENTFLIAFWDDEPVGYAKLKRGPAPAELQGYKSIQMERIYALQDYIGKKVGKELMTASLKIASAEKFEKIWLGVWEQNHTAVAFYKKWEFEVIGNRQFEIGNEIHDDFVMARNVPAATA